MNHCIRKIDKQGRLLIPLDLFSVSGLEHGSISLCAKSLKNIREGKFYLKNTKDVSPNDFVVCVRSIDEKRRIILKDFAFSAYLIYYNNKLVRIQLLE